MLQEQPPYTDREKRGFTLFRQGKLHGIAVSQSEKAPRQTPTPHNPALPAFTIIPAQYRKTKKEARSLVPDSEHKAGFSLVHLRLKPTLVVVLHCRGLGKRLDLLGDLRPESVQRETELGGLQCVRAHQKTSVGHMRHTWHSSLKRTRARPTFQYQRAPPKRRKGSPWLCSEDKLPGKTTCALARTRAPEHTLRRTHGSHTSATLEALLARRTRLLPAQCPLRPYQTAGKIIEWL